MFRKFRETDKNEYLTMTHIFHTSDAVLAPIDTAAYERTFSACLTSPYIDGYIFEDGGAVSGYATVAHSYSTEIGNECLWIEELFVKPDFRKRGIAGAFLRFLKEQYPSSVKRIRLEVEEENEGAVALYIKNGYKWILYKQMFADIDKED